MGTDRARFSWRAVRSYDPTESHREVTMFETTIAGSLPKPAWLAETNRLWPQWKTGRGTRGGQARRHAAY
jgi:hypothetical protein